MEIIIQPDPQTASEVVTRLILQLLREKPSCVLGLASGHTPLQLYSMLVQKHRDGRADFSQVTTFNVDDFVGIPADHPASFSNQIRTHFLDHVNVRREHSHAPDGMADDIPGFCRDYEAAIRAAGGIDLQILGLDSEGHIGFNEPTSSLASRTRIKSLTQRTRQDFAQLFGAEHRVPEHVITMGVGTIMEARTCVLMAFGRTKARAIANAVEGPISSSTPASILQMHPTTKIVIDEPAASMLRNTAYYRWAYEKKPDWQKF